MSESMRVTGCRVYLNPTDDDRLKAFASIVLNHEFAICDLKIIRGNSGLFVAMPSRRRNDGTFHDVAHPIVATLREHIESVVLGEYLNQATNQGAIDQSDLAMALTQQDSEYFINLEP